MESVDSANSSPSTGVTRVLNKLRASVNEGNYYEAHQMYRTLYFRYLNQKKYSDLLELLYDGAHLFFEKEKQASGLDLTNLFIDTLEKSNTPPSSSIFHKLIKLLERVPADTSQRDQVINSTLRWSSKSKSKVIGHPSLHESIAKMFWREKNYILARYHFLHSTDGGNFALMLIEVHRERGYANEIDLFIAQVVLQYLCLHNKVTANETFENYTTKHPNIQHGPPYILPLLNFIWFLLKIIETGKLVAFNSLCQQYQLSIKRDPSYSDYLYKIGQNFFGIQPSRPSPSRFLSNMLSSFMDAELDHDLEDSDEDVRPSTSSLPQPLH